MDYKIIDIEGVGDVYAKKLTEAGINKVSELLERCAAPKGRKELAKATDIPEKLILRWTNHADLFRIKGIGPQFSELLEAAGVDTVKELRNRKAENLQKALEETNAKKKLTRVVPPLKTVEKMIAQAKELKPMMTY
jgi:predicted flap endonuclease-1-like 5' DNA nuclease